MRVVVESSRKDRVGFVITIVMLCAIVLLFATGSVHSAKTLKTSKTTKTSTTTAIKEGIPNISIDNFGDIQFMNVEHSLTEEVASNLTKTDLSIQVGEMVSKQLSKITNVRESFLHADPFGTVYQIEDFSKTTQSLMTNSNNDTKLPPLKLELTFDKKNPNSDNATRYLDIVTPVTQILNNENNPVAYCVGRAASNLLANQITLQVLADLYGKVSTQYLSSKFTFEVSKSSYEKELNVYNPIVKRFNKALENMKNLINTKKELLSKQ
ncbi:predicted protein [Naegleria gruberi]|uniref:Predicted protein n=1 Tax=Naegleria gruberi TaxID=5762 RepID=D2V530_NAEGR|nr:uncharacterized protein NAEGRDRAFT_63995 [Naegleria gruberi]EFC48036.1 predicted protein [Naegleria gruberi]|eukprot:XP_002680780.1 predicted protein [Naegleria gruberi strain NEG-M]